MNGQLLYGPFMVVGSSRRFLLGLLIATAVAGVVVGFNAEQALDQQLHLALGYPPFRDDIGVLLSATRDLLHQNLGGSTGLLAAPYPAPTYFLYVPLAAIPGGLGDALAEVIALALVTLSLAGWARHVSRPDLVWPLLLSVPVVGLLRFDQANTAVCFASLIGSFFFLRRGSSIRAGMLLAVSMCHITNGLPVAIALGAHLLVRDRKAAAKAALGASIVLVPTVVLAFVLDPSWPHHFAAAQAGFAFQGIALPLQNFLGGNARLAVFAFSTLLATAIALTNRTPEIDSHRFSAIMALSLLGTHIGGTYVGIFALPAVLSKDRHTSAWVWIVSFVPWLASFPVNLELISNTFSEPISFLFVTELYWPLLVGPLAAIAVLRKGMPNRAQAPAGSPTS